MRLFVAMLLSDDVRSALQQAQEGLRRACPGIRWVRPDQLHLTVKFLGEVPDRDVAEVASAVSRAAQTGPPFDCEIAGLGCFPPRGAVRIVWAGVREESGALAQGVEAVEGELERLGFARERRPFSAHITIGRVREDRSAGRVRLAIEKYGFDPVEQAVSSITLMSSVLSPKGATYTPVCTAKLGPAEGP